MISKLKLLNQKPKIDIAPFILLLFLVIICIFSYNFYSYDVLSIQAINNCSDNCYLKLLLPYNKISVIKNATLIVEGNKVNIEDVKYENFEQVDNVIYQYISLKTALEDDRVYEVKFYSNKQRIIKRIINFMKEGST